MEFLFRVAKTGSSDRVTVSDLAIIGPEESFYRLLLTCIWNHRVDEGPENSWGPNRLLMLEHTQS